VNSKTENQKPARVLIVDDHAIVRYGMGVLLSGANDLTLCGEAGTYDEALTAIRELSPDIAVIDLILYDRSGLDLIRQIRAEGLTLPLLVMSMHDEATHAEKALRAGAQGYIMKEDADEVLVEALRTVLSGKLHVSGNINEKLLRTYVESDDSVASSGVESLTDREKEIFECLGKGFTTRKIAEQFNLSPRTVEVHRASIKKKLECEDAAQLLRTAVQWVESRTL
jgi:DNA-binding NarL/FixJ family response regulator